jgi:hypothetical protein
MNTDVPAYGLWLLVVINAAVFVIFAFSFTHPRTGRDWRSFGAFSVFVVALFTRARGSAPAFTHGNESRAGRLREQETIERPLSPIPKRRSQ